MIKYRKKWKYTKHNYIYLVLLLPILAVSIGYAMLNANVGMTGRTQIGDLRWNVAVDNTTLSYIDGTNTQVNNSPPTINGTSISYDISLPELGDYYQFEFKIKNTGTIPAKLNEIVNTSDDKSYIVYSYKYKDGTDVTIGDSIKANYTTTMVVKIEFRLTEQLSEEELANVVTTLNSSISFNYNQANPNELNNSYTDPIRITSNEHATVNSISNNITATTNLYDSSASYPNAYYYTDADYGNNGDLNVISLTIPVIKGDHILASSFLDKSQNGSEGTQDGVRVTFLDDTGVVSSLSASDVYDAYTTDGYIEIPDNVTAVNIPYYKADNNNNLYIINPENEVGD